jgi:carbonic anhydrase/acetyltransferase-like protein (isoleucine patch superfamily)
MGPKYEFTAETMNRDGHILHRIKRLSDDKLCGWIEKEENLSQEGNCWVDGNATVYGDAQVYGNAIVCGDARVYGNAQVYGNAIVCGDARVYGKAKVYGDAEVYGKAKVYDNAYVYGNAYVCGNAKVYDNAQVCGHAKVDYELRLGTVGDESTNEQTDENTTALKDFVYRIDDSSKLDIQSRYDSIDAFFENMSDESYENKESITIIAVDTKIPLVKLEKTKLNDRNVFKFIVDISNDEDTFSVKAIFDTKEKFNQLLQSTIIALSEYPQFVVYTDELENCL